MSALKRRLSASRGTGQNTLSKRVWRSWSLCPKLTKGSLLRTRPWRHRENSKYGCSLTRRMRQLRLWASSSQRRVQPQRGPCLGLKLSHPNRRWTNYRQRRRPYASRCTAGYSHCRTCYCCANNITLDPNRAFHSEMDGGVTEKG